MKQHNNSNTTVKLLALVIHIAFSTTAIASNYYWVGGTGNWSDYANHWATTNGGNTFHTSAPTTADDVYFTAQSFSSANSVVTLDSVAYCHNLTFTGITDPQKLASTVFTNGLNIDGSMTLYNKLQYDIHFPFFKFTSNSTGNTLNTNTATLPNNVFFTGTGEWTFASNVTATFIYFNSGILNTNGYQAFFYSFQSTTNNTRTLNLGNSYINSYYWTVDNSSNNFNLIKGNSNLESVYFKGGGLLYANFTIGSMGVATVGDNNFFDTIFVANYNQVNFEAGTTQNANALIQAYTSSCILKVALTGDNGIATINIPSGNINFSDIIIHNLTVTGSATFNAFNSYGIGNTNGWNISSGPANRNFYWIGDDGVWMDGSHWSLTSGGTAINCVPGPFDNVYFDQNSFSTGGQNVFIDMPAYCKTMDWSGVQNSPTLAGFEYDINVCGAFILDSNMSSSFVPNINFISDSVGNTIDLNGIDHLGGVKFYGKGNWNLATNFTTGVYGSPLILLQGTINTNGHDVTAYEFKTSGDSAKTLDISNSKVMITTSWSAESAFNLIDSNSVIELTNNGKFIGKGMNYYHVNFKGTNGYEIFDNNIFDTLTLTPSGSYLFDTSNTQKIDVLNFSSMPSSGQEITIKSNSVGTKSKINLTGDKFCGDYLIVQDINSIGNHFFAGPNSTDNGNNSKVYFINCTAPLSINITDSMNVLCFGDSTGWAKFSIGGGLLPYNYSWSNGAASDSTGGLSAGTYTVFVWDALNDTISRVIIITEPAPIALNFAIGIDSICSNHTSINLNATPSGGTFSGNGVVGTTFNPALLSSAGLTYITYTFVDTSGCSQSKTDSIFVNVCTGIDKEAKQIITVNPNPATNTVFFSSSSINAEPISIINAMGMEVYKDIILKSYTADLSYLPSGIYTIKIGSNNNSSYTKLVKQ
ncbi:MAG: T9SS type A sorting domain-containing protein [Bacteroidetes bacterium]|nr:T9SS type A sorting domain-containing protein [Bacteroidota bacterium]